jgi:hypothetical protein
MIAHLVLFLIEVVIQTVFLALALWIMIMIQKLNYQILGLLGTAALVSAIDRGLDLVLGHYLGTYETTSISTPFVLAVLYFCLKKVTLADRTDIYFTVGVGYALVFCMNLWLLGALLGDLRPSARFSEPDNTAALATETNDTPDAPPTPPAASVTNPPARSAAIPAAPDSPFVINGITRNGANSTVTVQNGKKTMTIFLGEAVMFQTADGPASVRFKELNKDSVVLTVNDRDKKLPIH